MLGGWFRLKRPRHGEGLEYSVSPVRRAGFAVAAVLIATAVAAAAGRVLDARNLLAYILALASALAAGYDERWTFSSQRVEHRWGLFGLGRCRTWLRHEIGFLRLAEIRLALGRTLVSFSLGPLEGKALQIDLARGASADRLREVAREVARASGIPLEP